MHAHDGDVYNEKLFSFLFDLFPPFFLASNFEVADNILHDDRLDVVVNENKKM